MDARSPCLILFVRYPEAGQTKTRLIPALGAEGAAQLYRRMAEGTVRQVRALQRDGLVVGIVAFTGGDRAKMQAWLGDGWIYQEQEGGSLGDRMNAAFGSAFQLGYAPMVLIGTDCPGLDRSLLSQAFEALTQADVVFGPATDGGYYLVGLNQPCPALFEGIPWSTDRVLADSLAVADRLGLRVGLLPERSDIDRPEDLPMAFL